MRTAFVLACLLCTGCYRSHERAVDADVDAPRVCPPMDAYGLPGCTVGVDGWAFWNGTACMASVCACRGSECDRVYPDLDSCARAHDGCPR